METYTAGELIRQFREAEGLSQQELADIIHVSQAKLAHWEENATIPRPTMVARLTGALRLSNDKADRLVKAVDAAQAIRAQENVAAQAVINKQNDEIERLRHKRKALALLGSGLLGFAGGCLFTFLTGSYKDVWYFPLAIGALTAGIPFGWGLISKPKEPYEVKYYYTDPIIDIIATVVKFLLKFMLAYFIGVFAFPFALFYHAYKAGRKGSLYRTIMFIVFVAVSLFVGIILVIILMNAFK